VLNDGDPDEARLALRRLSSGEPEEAPIQEALEAPRGDPVTVYDVLDMHEFLASFDGDFRALFSEG
jgi:hypothetical protein